MWSLLVHGPARACVGRGILRRRRVGESLRAWSAVADKSGRTKWNAASPAEVSEDRRRRAPQGPEMHRRQTGPLLVGSDISKGCGLCCRADRAMALSRETNGVRARTPDSGTSEGLAGLDERGTRMGGWLLRRGRMYVSRESPDARRLQGAAAICSAIMRGWYCSRTPSTSRRPGRLRQDLRRSPRQGRRQAIQALAHPGVGGCSACPASSLAVHRQRQTRPGPTCHACHQYAARSSARQSGLRGGWRSLLPTGPRQVDGPPQAVQGSWQK